MKARSVEFKGLKGFAEAGVVVRGTSIRLEFQFRSKQEKARFCSLDGVRTESDFQDLLDDAHYELRSIKRKIQKGDFTDELYATMLPESSFAQKRGGSRSTNTFTELAKQYLDDQEYLVKRGDISAGTVYSRKKCLITSPHMKKLVYMKELQNNAKHYLLYQQGLGEMRVADVSFDVLKKLQNYLYHHAPRVEGKFGYSEKMVNNMMDAIRQVFKYALQEKIVDEDPSANIRTLRVPTKNKLEDLSFFDLDQQDAIQGFCEDSGKSWLSDMFLFGCWTGLRKQELMALSWEDIDLNSNTVTITRSYTKESGLHHPKTKTSYRTFTMLDEARAILDRVIGWTGESESVDYQVMRPENNGHVTENLTLVFQNHAKGGPVPRAWNYASIRKAWSLVKEKTEVNIPISQTRHTYATIQLSSNRAIEEVARELGHGDQTMVNRHYGDIVEKFNVQMIANKNRAVADLLSNLDRSA